MQRELNAELGALSGYGAVVAPLRGANNDLIEEEIRLVGLHRVQDHLQRDDRRGKSDGNADFAWAAVLAVILGGKYLAAEDPAFVVLDDSRYQALQLRRRQGCRRTLEEVLAKFGTLGRRQPILDRRSLAGHPAITDQAVGIVFDRLVVMAVQPPGGPGNGGNNRRQQQNQDAERRQAVLQRGQA